MRVTKIVLLISLFVIAATAGERLIDKVHTKIFDSRFSAITTGRDGNAQFTLLGTEFKSLVVSADSIPLKEGSIFYYGYIPSGDIVFDTTAITAGYNLQRAKSTVTLFLDFNQIDSNYISTYLGEPSYNQRTVTSNRELKGGASILNFKGRRFNLLWAASLSQLFNSGGAVKVGSDKTLFTNKFSPSDPDLTTNLLAGVVKRVNMNYTFILSADISYRVARSSNFVDEGFLKDAIDNGYRFVSFGNNNIDKSTTTLRLSLNGPTTSSRYERFQRGSRQSSPHFALSGAELHISQINTKVERESINYHLDNGVVNTASITSRSGSISLGANSNLELLIFKHGVVGFNEVFITDIVKQNAIWDNSPNRYIFTVKMFPHLGFRGAINSRILLNSNIGINYIGEFQEYFTSDPFKKSFVASLTLGFSI